MRVGHIVATHKAVRRQHLMVAEEGGRRVRGLFSAVADRAPARRGAADHGGRADLRRHRGGAGRARWRGPLPRGLRGASAGTSPRDFNIAHWPLPPLGRGAPTASRCYWEDESGETRALTLLRDLQQAANRALQRARRTRRRARRPRGDHPAAAPRDRRSPTSPCFQMGAIAVPLSFLFGPDALEYRLADSGARVAIVDPQTLAEPGGRVRARLPALEHVIGVAGARGARRARLGRDARAAPRDASSRCDTRADRSRRDHLHQRHHRPAEGRAAAALGAASATCPASSTRTTASRSEGDLFWSPADWAWTGGLWDALMPTLYHGRAILGYRGRFDAERAFAPAGEVRDPQRVPLPHRAQDDDEGGARAARALRPAAALAHERRRARGPRGVPLVRASELGVTVNEIFGQTEMNYIVGNSHALWPVKPGSMGRPYPGPSHRGDRRRRARARAAGEVGDVAVHRRWIDGTPDPVFFLGYWGNDAATREEVHRRLVPHRRPGLVRRGRLPLVPGARRRHVQERGLPHRARRDRELPGEARRGRQLRRGADPRRDARRGDQGLRAAGARARRPRRRSRTRSAST